MNQRILTLLLALGAGAGIYFYMKKEKERERVRPEQEAITVRPTRPLVTPTVVPQQPSHLAQIVGAFKDIRCVLNPRLCSAPKKLT